MIKFKRYGKTVRIGNKHWENFRERFNPENARKHMEKYRIEVKCSLCYVFKPRCQSANGVHCPFNQFTTRDTVGCQKFFERLFKNGMFFWSDDYDEVTWNRDFDKSARKQLLRIQKLMDEIEKEQD